MLFFAVMVVATGLMFVPAHFRVPGLQTWAGKMRVGMAAGPLFTGTDHLLSVERYLAMMPGAIPSPKEVVILTGILEIAGAIGLLIPGLRRLAGLCLAVYLVAVFPANVGNAVYGVQVEGLPTAAWYYWVRLPFQPLYIWWALYSSRASDWFGLLPRLREIVWRR